MFYEYECPQCGTITTVNCKMKDMKREVPCEECGTMAVKVISAPYLKGVSSTKQAIKREMMKKNEIAGKKCRGSHKTMKASFQKE
jgi:putative FmdB family regulatory protein